MAAKKKLTKKMIVEARDALKEGMPKAETFTCFDFPTNDGIFRVRAYPDKGWVNIWRASLGDGPQGGDVQFLQIRSKVEFDQLAETLNMAYIMNFRAPEPDKDPR